MVSIRKMNTFEVLLVSESISTYQTKTNMLGTVHVFLIHEASSNICINVQSIFRIVRFFMPVIILISMSVLLWTRQKNDQRNSGGTLRQKFNLIDIWHLIFDILHFTFNQWTNAPMFQCSNVPMDQWTNGSMDPWTNGPMDKKLFRPYEKKNTLEHWNIGT